MENNHTIVRSITLVDQIENLILNYIVENKLTSGAEIPSELILAEEFNVGRNVVREALSRLRMLGVIESRKHRGILLREPDVLKCFAKVINPYLLSRDSILDLLDFRVSIETGISGLVIDNVTDDDILDLEKTIEKQEYVEDMKLKVDYEIEFHSKIYKITRNHIIISFLEMIVPLFSFVHENFEDFRTINKKNEGQLVRHEDLLVFLKSRDVNGYRSAIYNHLKAYSEYVKLNRCSNA